MFFLHNDLSPVQVEIFDECSFSVDERVAWATIQLRETVFSGETVEDWYPLTGKCSVGRQWKIGTLLLVSVQWGDSGRLVPSYW